MNSPMIIKVTLLGKLLPALFTLIGAITPMQPQMSYKIVLLIENLETLITLELVVTFHMLTEMELLREYF